MGDVTSTYRVWEMKVHAAQAGVKEQVLRANVDRRLEFALTAEAPFRVDDSPVLRPCIHCQTCLSSHMHTAILLQAAFFFF